MFYKTLVFLRAKNVYLSEVLGMYACPSSTNLNRVYQQKNY